MNSTDQSQLSAPQSLTSTESGVHAFSIEQKSALPSYAQSVRWVGFCQSTAVTRTLVHFFPSAGNVTAPYAANCKLTVFGRGLTRRSLQIEGARLSHPDGLKIEDVFPEVRENTSSLYGIEIELSTGQQRVDMSASSSIFEIVTGGQSVKYLPAQGGSNRIALQGSQIKSKITALKAGNLKPTIAQKTESPPLITDEATPGVNGPASGSLLSASYNCMALNDAFTTSSLVILNLGKLPVHPVVLVLEGGKQQLEGEAEAGIRIPIESVLPECVNEIPLDDRVFANSPAVETSWGLVRALPVQVQFPTVEIAASSATFLLFRDRLTKRITAARMMQQ